MTFKSSVERWFRTVLGLLPCLLLGVLSAVWAAPVLPAPVLPAGAMAQLLGAHYAAWTPLAADTTPLALMHVQGLDWVSASAQMQPLYDDVHAYAELRGFQAMSGEVGSVGVLRAALYRTSITEGVLVLDDDWCAAGLCKSRNSFVLTRLGKANSVLSEKQLVPRILDSDLLAVPRPDCLKGVTLGVQYLPSRSGTSLTAVATVSPLVRRECEATGTELALVTRPLRLNWKASARKFVRGW
jgi:hypothetical protein